MLIEGMFYLYKYNLLHRNLKPSSVYISNAGIETSPGSFELKIGAFGAISIIKDARTKTRMHPRKHNTASFQKSWVRFKFHVP